MLWVNQNNLAQEQTAGHRIKGTGRGGGKNNYVCVEKFVTGMKY